MSKKVLTMLAVGLGVSGGLFGTVNAFAASAEGQRDIPVTYTGQDTIPDPDNPESPQWQVGITKGIHFTDDKKNVDLSVELQDTNYQPNMDTNLRVDVSVKSANGYDLKKGLQKVEYEVSYDSVMNKNDSKQLIGTLIGGAGTYKKTGSAKLLGSSNELGRYEDTLTYFVQKQ